MLRIESAYGHPYLDLSEALVEYPEIVFELNLKYGSADITLPRGASADTQRRPLRVGQRPVPGRGRPHPGPAAPAGERQARLRQTPHPLRRGPQGPLVRPYLHPVRVWLTR